MDRSFSKYTHLIVDLIPTIDKMLQVFHICMISHKCFNVFATFLWTFLTRWDWYLFRILIVSFMNLLRNAVSRQLISTLFTFLINFLRIYARDKGLLINVAGFSSIYGTLLEYDYNQNRIISVSSQFASSHRSKPRHWVLDPYHDISSCTPK